MIDLELVLYILTVFFAITTFSLWAKLDRLERKFNKVIEQDYTIWERLVEARKLIVSVNIKTQLNIDQFKLWYDFIREYKKLVKKVSNHYNLNKC